MAEHVVVVGYGTKGRSAVETLVNNGLDRSTIVVVDKGGDALQDAHADGLAVVTGDATRRDVLRRAGVARAQQVIITTDRDDSNVLATLTVRQLNPDAWIVSAVREQENAPLMKQSGADSVITSSDAVGRLLGLSTLSPTLGSVMEDLLTYGQGLEVAERELLVPEVGQQPQSLPDQVIAVVRDEKVYRYFDPVVTQLESTGKFKSVVDTRTEKGMNDVYGGDYHASVIYIQDDFIKKNPNTVQAVVNAMVRANRWIAKATPQQIVDLMPEEFKAGNPSLYKEGLLKNMIGYSEDGQMSMKADPFVPTTVYSSRWPAR